MLEIEICLVHNIVLSILCVTGKDAAGEGEPEKGKESRTCSSSVKLECDVSQLKQAGCRHATNTNTTTTSGATDQPGPPATGQCILYKSLSTIIYIQENACL